MNLAGFSIGLAVLGAVAWLVLNRKNKTPFYHGFLGALLLPAWVWLGLIYALGPWHDLRAGAFRFVGSVLVAPFHLTFYLFGGDTHYLVVFFAAACTGFFLGLGLGFLRRGRLEKKQVGKTGDG